MRFPRVLALSLVRDPCLTDGYHLRVTETARRFLETFQVLPDLDKGEVLVALLREAIRMPPPASSEADLTAAADEVFLDLDRWEAGTDHVDASW